MSDFAIEIVEHHWLAGTDPAADLCSHGRVFVRVAGEAVVTPADGEFTLSAAALYLLRALERDHTPKAPVGEHLLPCCGHVLIPPERGSEVVILGCPNGIDWTIVHEAGQVGLFDLRSHPPLTDGRSISCRLDEMQYREAIVSFAEAVWLLFDGADKQIADEEDRLGYAAFRREYRRRLASARDGSR